MQHTDGDTDTDYSNLILGIVLLVWTCIESAIGTTCIAIGDDGDIREMLPDQCTVVRNGRDIAINASDLVVGDVLHLEMGMKVPADVRLFEVLISLIPLARPAPPGSSIPAASSTPN